VRRAFVIVLCLVGTACSATGPDPRPRASGFATAAGVVDPYGDGKQHLMAGRYQVAIERFGQALARDRRSLDALNGLAIAHTRLGRFDIAQTYFERALQVDATNAVTLNNYGWSLIEQGRLRDAKPFLELALRHAAAADLPVVAANIESMGAGEAVRPGRGARAGEPARRGFRSAARSRRGQRLPSESHGRAGRRIRAGARRR
jgi:Tfp pilus assembly protein PilF